MSKPDLVPDFLNSIGDAAQRNVWLRLVSEQLPAIFWTTDTRLVTTFLAGAALKPLGLTPGKPVAASMYEYFAGQPHPSIAHSEAALRGESSRYRASDLGRTFDVRLEPLRSPRGDIVGTIGLALDITEQAESENQLRALHAQLDSLAQHVPGMLFQTRMSSSGPPAVAYVSAKSLKYLGYTPEEIYRDPDLMLNAIHPLDRAEYFRRAATAMRDFSQFCMEFRVIDKNQTERWLDVRSTPVRTPNGDLLFNGVAIDISDRKLAEQELARLNADLELRVDARTQELKQANAKLRESSRFIDRIAAATPAILYVFDLEENRNVYTNDKLAEILGYSRDEAERHGTRMFLDLFHPDDMVVIQAAREAFSHGADGQIFTWEYRMRDVHGQWRWLRSHDTIFQRNSLGAAKQILGIALEVTAEKKAEATIHAEQKLLRKLLELHQRERHLFAYEIHDGFVQQLIGAQLRLGGLAGWEPPAPPAMQQELHSISELLRETIAEARRLISELRPQVIDQQGLVAAIDDLVRDVSAATGVEIMFRHHVTFDRLAPVIEGNVFRIVQEALNNVKRHARASSVLVRLRELPGRLRVDIIDDGVGFDTKQVPRGRFGLEGIQERARIFGGWSRVDSSPGKGTTVTAEVPLTLPEGDQPPLECPNPSDDDE